MSVRFVPKLLVFSAAVAFPSAPVLPAVAPNGYLIVFTAAIDLTIGERGGIYVMRPDGSGMRQLTSFQTDHFNYSGDGFNLPDDHASFSPDGKKIIFTSSRDHVTGALSVNSPDNFELYTMNANGSNVRRLTSNDSLDTEPVFSPDGAKVAFVSERAQKGNRDIWGMQADGTEPVRLTSDIDADMEPAWSPDGTKIAYTRVTFEGILGTIGQQKDVWIMNADGTGQRQLTDLFNEDHDPTFSPDGTQLVITSELGKASGRSDRWPVAVHPTPVSSWLGR